MNRYKFSNLKFNSIKVDQSHHIRMFVILTILIFTAQSSPIIPAFYLIFSVFYSLTTVYISSKNDFHLIAFVFSYLQCKICSPLKFRVYAWNPYREKSIPQVKKNTQNWPGGGYSHIKLYRNVPPKWVSFFPKIFRKGSHSTKIMKN